MRNTTSENNTSDDGVENQQIAPESAEAPPEVRVLGDEIFQQPIESLITTSRDSERAVFLSGSFGEATPYLVVCLASDEAASIKVAQMLVEDLICGEEAPRAHPGLRQKAWRKYRAYRQPIAGRSDTA